MQGFVPPGGIWKCLETFLVVKTGEGAITGSGSREARDAA